MCMCVHEGGVGEGEGGMHESYRGRGRARALRCAGDCVEVRV